MVTHSRALHSVLILTWIEMEFVRVKILLLLALFLADICQSENVNRYGKYATYQCHC